MVYLRCGGTSSFINCNTPGSVQTLGNNRGAGSHCFLRPTGEPKPMVVRVTGKDDNRVPFLALVLLRLCYDYRLECHRRVRPVCLVVSRDVCSRAWGTLATSIVFQWDPVASAGPTTVRDERCSWVHTIRRGGSYPKSRGSFDGRAGPIPTGSYKTTAARYCCARTNLTNQPKV